MPSPWDQPVGGSMVDPDTFWGHRGISTQTFCCCLEPYLPLGAWKSGLQTMGWAGTLCQAELGS